MRADSGPPRIHITGASGTGASTLGRALGARIGAVHLDTDDFYWEMAAPLYTVKHTVPERLRRLNRAFAQAGARGWVLSGGVGAWADPIVPLFTLVVFLSAPTDARVARLRQREIDKFGDEARDPASLRGRQIEAFLRWAATYDIASGAQGRSRSRHEAWLAMLPCPVLRLDGLQPIDTLIESVVAQIKAAG